ncbi:MAG: UDP-N-acetylmuramoyl-tripeptide--D-alanyl-D-alanine ligase [Actinobacteria bacterium]|nr:UDP-N-acetylmuramoyl-tripeptide--D-alanyl-D-alanine ligase [Actinomycetota bacterium]
MSRVRPGGHVSEGRRVIPVGWQEIEALGLGRLEGGDLNTPVRGIKADSREVGPGDLFVALNTGVEHVGDARTRGAATLVPDDQEAALSALASLVRSKSSASVVAVVGSAGKTSTKDILAALCAPHAATLWPEKSLNNEIGLPLTICRLEPETEILVTEMGMRGLGQVAALSAIARPDIAVVPHIGPEHLELLGTVERVAEANAEAIAALPTGGTAVVPAKSTELEPFLNRVDIELRRFDAADAELEDGRGRFQIDGQTVELDLPFTQRHHAVNTLAALHAYAALGLPLEHASAGAPQIRLSPWRGEEIPLPGGGFVVNDAYNANPDSMRAALVHLAERAGTRRRVAVLGEMAELGDSSPRYHREIGELARDLEIEIIAVGEPTREYGPTVWVPGAEGAVEAVRGFLRPGDSVLVKASRAVGLEGIPLEIAKIARAWSQS